MMSLQWELVGKCDRAPGAAPQWDGRVRGSVTSERGRGLLGQAEVLTEGGPLSPRELDSTPTPKLVLKTRSFLVSPVQ